MLENRRHMRIRSNTDVRWTLLGSEVIGEGKVLNISESGMLLLTDGNYNPRLRGAVYVDAPGADPLEFGPKKGKVMWTKRMEHMAGFQCGIQFDRTNTSDKRLTQWLDAKQDEIGQIADARILANYIQV